MGSIGKELVITKEEVNISFDQKLVSRTKWNLQRETLYGFIQGLSVNWSSLILGGQEIPIISVV